MGLGKSKTLLTSLSPCRVYRPYVLRVFELALGFGIVGIDREVLLMSWPPAQVLDRPCSR